MGDVIETEVDQPKRKSWWRETWVRAVAAGTLVCVLALGILAEYVARHAEPVLRDSVVLTLEQRFHSPVELDQLHISAAEGLEVRGDGLRILYLTGPTQPENPQGPGGQPPVQPTVNPMLSIKQFRFHTSLRGLLHLRTRIETVYVEGMELHIPPHSISTTAKPEASAAAKPEASKQPTIAMVVNKIVCKDAQLVIETTKPGKLPLRFDIRNLVLRDVGASQPLVYAADLIIPKPIGRVRADGHFGPWQGDDPRATPIDGDYTFDHADLGSIHGLRGTLSSTGHYAGELGYLTVDGTTETPDFALDLSGHALPLHTSFHAYVDGTTGDTTLAPVQARLRNSTFTATGAVVRVRDPANGKMGHDIALDVTMPQGRIEDLLELGMKTQPPVMRGNVAMRTKVHVPPGPQRVAEKLQLAGTLSIQGIEFSNAKWQDRVDDLSLRAQGKPQEVKVAGSDGRPEVASRMSVNFVLANSMVKLSSLVYQVPGAQALLNGVYSMDGNIFEFEGHVRTDAKASQMVTGWKSALLKPFDKFLEKNGAGVQLPVAIHGVKSDVSFGLALHGADETPDQIAADLRARKAAAARK